MRNSGTSKGPPDSTEVGGGGGGVKSDRNLDNSDSFDKHVSQLIAFSHWLLCFGAILPYFIFDLV